MKVPAKDTHPPLSPRQPDIFWNEIAAIQRRWQPFFTDEQKQTISIEISKKESILRFSDTYDLPEEVSREIGIIYKMVAEDDDIYDEYQLLRGEGRGVQSSSPSNTESIPKEYRKNRYRSAPPQ